jgi:adenosylhomocysteine nucleosidase
MWQWVLRSWLQKQAVERVSEAVRQRVDSEQEKASADALRPCQIGLVFALGIEAGPLVDLMEEVATISGHKFTAREGMLDGRRLVVMQAGAGREAAARCTEALIDGHQPQWIISAGLAGGLDEALARNDILMADHLSDEAGTSLSVDFKIAPEALAGAPHLHVGRLLTVDHIIHRPEEKKALGERHRALAVDMESIAVAEVCQKRKVRFLSVRVISDGVGDRLPVEVERLMNQTTLAGKLGAATGAIFRRPSSVKDMLALKETALIAADRLAKFLTGVIGQLEEHE